MSASQFAYKWFNAWRTLSNVAVDWTMSSAMLCTYLYPGRFGESQASIDGSKVVDVRLRLEVTNYSASSAVTISTHTTHYSLVLELSYPARHSSPSHMSTIYRVWSAATCHTDSLWERPRWSPGGTRPSSLVGGQPMSWQEMLDLQWCV